MNCEGLHCPGCGHGGGGVLGALAAVAAAAVAYEVIAALLWAIVATVAAVLVIATVAAVVIARRMNAPVPQLTRYRIPAAPYLEHSLPAGPGIGAAPAGASYAELEARLRDAEINARAAVLAAGIIAQQTRPLPVSGPYTSTERVIPG